MFHSEISGMMHAFGDIKQSNVESVQLVEEIIYQEITELISDSVKMVSRKNGKSILLSDILFIMRRDKQKLQAAVNYLKKRKAFSQISNLPDEEDLEDETQEPNAKAVSSYRALRASLDFLTEKEQDELLQYRDYDIEHQQKLDEHTKSMSLSQYNDFTQSRRASFVNKKKFKDWLCLQSLVADVKVHEIVIELLAYIAYRSVQSLVEMSLIVKQEQKSYIVDPTGSTAPSTTPISLPQEVLSYENTPSFLTPPTGEATPPGSPKNSPGTMTSPTHIITKSRSRKRSRQSKSSVTEPPLQTPPPIASPLTVPPTAIQPEHVHEAIRRYMCTTTGPHLPFTSHFMKQKFRNRSV